jgi:hypothetical protein
VALWPSWFPIQNGRNIYMERGKRFVWTWRSFSHNKWNILDVQHSWKYSPHS